MPEITADFRYPIGNFEPQPYSEALKQQWISDIKFLPNDIELAIQNLDEYQLDTPYREGGWTVKQLVHHVKKKLNLFNQSDDMRGFHPHVTVAFRDLKKPVFYKLWEEYGPKTFDRTFRCKSFSLLKHVNDEWIVFKEFHIKS